MTGEIPDILIGSYDTDFTFCEKVSFVFDYVQVFLEISNESLG